MLVIVVLGHKMFWHIHFVLLPAPWVRQICQSFSTSFHNRIQSAIKMVSAGHWWTGNCLWFRARSLPKWWEYFYAHAITGATLFRLSMSMDFDGIMWIAVLVKRAMNGILLLLTILNVYSHFLVDEKFERTAPALVRYTSLFLNWKWIFWQWSLL